MGMKNDHEDLTGATVLYREDGAQYKCAVLDDYSETGVDNYKLRVDGVYCGDRYGHTATVGEVFDVMQRTDSGAWGGMWHVEVLSRPEIPA